MPGVGELATICKTVVEGGAAVLAKFQAMHLTDEMITLLAHAAKPGRDQGTFHVLDVDHPYPVVRAGGSSFAMPEDRAASARYYDAFKQLCERGYVQHDSGVLFTLTSAGFAKAGKLSAE